MGGGGQNFICRGWGGHKYDFHFLFWHQNDLASGGLRPQNPLSYHVFFSSSMPHFSPPPPKNENMKRYAYAEMLSVRFFCGNAHRHLIIRKYRHFIRCILFPTSVIRKVNLQHPHPTRNGIVSCQEIESYRYIMFIKLSSISACIVFYACSSNVFVRPERK